jgi:hypothetical protein
MVCWNHPRKGIGAARADQGQKGMSMVGVRCSQHSAPQSPAEKSTIDEEHNIGCLRRYSCNFGHRDQNHAVETKYHLLESYFSGRIDVRLYTPKTAHTSLLLTYLDLAPFDTSTKSTMAMTVQVI